MSAHHLGEGYTSRRDWIGRYFDARAERWEMLTGAAPVGRIRTTVRDGRREVQDAVLSWLPSDLTGVSILDAGCGPGSFCVRLAERGAQVTGIDVSAALVDVARARASEFQGPGSIELRVGDMLGSGPDEESFDYIVALDSLINYPVAELRQALIGIAGKARRGVIFTVAPRTRTLAAMHGFGKLFPRSNRAPAIEPVATGPLVEWVNGADDMERWAVANRHDVHRGFYISTAFALRPSLADARAAVDQAVA